MGFSRGKHVIIGLIFEHFLSKGSWCMRQLLPLSNTSCKHMTNWATALKTPRSCFLVQSYRLGILISFLLSAAVLFIFVRWLVFWNTFYYHTWITRLSSFVFKDQTRCSYSVSSKQRHWRNSSSTAALKVALFERKLNGQVGEHAS